MNRRFRKTCGCCRAVKIPINKLWKQTTGKQLFEEDSNHSSGAAHSHTWAPSPPWDAAFPLPPGAPKSLQQMAKALTAQQPLEKGTNICTWDGTAGWAKGNFNQGSKTARETGENYKQDKENEGSLMNSGEKTNWAFWSYKTAFCTS